MLGFLLPSFVVIVLFAGLTHGGGDNVREGRGTVLFPTGGGDNEREGHGRRRRTTTVLPTVPTVATVPPIDVCPGRPPCLPVPSIDCVSSYVYDNMNGTACLYSCTHWCCSTVEALLLSCPTTNPDDPYCVATNIVSYIIRGRECPVYCGCVPDCSRLIC
ncbi:uncharacterized protein LOC127874277 [Dreissena polymorpha]|nr:uncharacterized protein LOC127874277 [Dreissena polymorpha]